MKRFGILYALFCPHTDFFPIFIGHRPVPKRCIRPSTTLSLDGSSLVACNHEFRVLLDLNYFDFWRNRFGMDSQYQNCNTRLTQDKNSNKYITRLVLFRIACMQIADELLISASWFRVVYAIHKWILFQDESSLERECRMRHILIGIGCSTWNIRNARFRCEVHAECTQVIYPT